MDIFATTAQLPGLSVHLALEKIHDGLHEGIWGPLKTDHIQICPQTFGVVSDDVAHELVEKYPQTKLRLHANARVLPKHVLWDVSTFSQDTKYYYEQLFLRQKVFKSPMMSIHAGYRGSCSWSQWLLNVQHLRSLAQSVGTDMCVEGLYPLKAKPQYIDSFKEYQFLMDNDIPYALDLSHLNIVAKHEKWDMALVKDLLSSPLCMEVHVSDNDGHRDSHALVSKPPVWLGLLNHKSDHAVVFSEGCLLPRRVYQKT